MLVKVICGLNKILIQIVSGSGNINEYNLNTYKMCDNDIVSDNDEINNNTNEDKNQINIWTIISIIQSVVIIILLSLKFRKKV